MAMTPATTAKASGFGIRERRLVYGLNVVLTAVLALALVSLAVWAAGRYG
jgi:hypothetical protein